MNAWRVLVIISDWKYENSNTHLLILTAISSVILTETRDKAVIVQEKWDVLSLHSICEPKQCISQIISGSLYLKVTKITELAF
jgi:hypothetical protein